MSSELLNNILLGDAIEIMRQIPDNYVDMSFADPPFNLKKQYNSYRDNKTVEEYLSWSRLWLKELVRITKPSGSIFVHNIPKWLIKFAGYLDDIAHFRHWIVWDAMGSPLGKTLLPSHYGILWYTKSKGFKFYDIRGPHKRCRKCGNILKDYGGKKKKMHPYGPLLSDVWTDIHRIKHRKRRNEHPCQLPIPLLERLILMTTDEGDIVFDPFVGTGTTVVAAKRLGRQYIGIDIDAKYIEITKQNLSKAVETKINDCYVSIYLNKILTLRDSDWEKLKDAFVIPQNIAEVEKTEIKLKKNKKFDLHDK